ncbi:BON domain-containing protein [Flavisolibacter tropicus]|uniref:BON domain-containing protein n=1 Tax=Flavisolibacter tropicus TaxID=1492898 RepID=UPI0008319CD0|nr:BON domain-containing protein [Flavisolibacter tropicus]
MEDQYRNEHNQSNNPKRENNDKHRQRNQYNQQGNTNQGYSDLDGDGFIGHTGGFYGGTSYLGANYDDWNNNLGPSSSNEQYRNENQQRNRNQQNYQRSNRFRDDQYYYNQDNPYGNSNYQRMSDNVGYERGFENQQPNFGNRSKYDDYQSYNKREEGQGYRGASNYNMNRESFENQRRNEYNQRDERFGGQYGRRQGNYSTKGDWDRSGNQSRSQHNRNDDRNWLERTADKVSSWFSSDDDNRSQREQRANMSGPHRGKGPKGYQRSAERIRDDVHDRLHDDPYVDASDIEVDVNQSEVILKGYVATREAKRRAEDIVESISGVRNVENRLRVGQPDTHSGSSDIYRNSSDKNQTKGKGDADRDITV